MNNNMPTDSAILLRCYMHNLVRDSSLRRLESRHRHQLDFTLKSAQCRNHHVVCRESFAIGTSLCVRGTCDVDSLNAPVLRALPYFIEEVWGP